MYAADKASWTKPAADTMSKTLHIVTYWLTCSLPVNPQRTGHNQEDRPPHHKLVEQCEDVAQILLAGAAVHQRLQGSRQERQHNGAEALDHAVQQRDEATADCAVGRERLQ